MKRIKYVSVSKEGVEGERWIEAETEKDKENVMFSNVKLKTKRKSESGPDATR